MSLKNVSVCMIVKNEERTLARCLSSFYQIIGEIVIVDTGSSDRTVHIAKAFGARTYHFPTTREFAVARNFALSKCTSDWILVLDADEYIDPHQLDLLENLTDGDKRAAYKFWRCSFLPGGGWDLDWITRLFPNVEGLQYTGQVHEQIYPCLEKSGVFFRQVDFLVLHFGYLEAGDRFLDKQRKYASLQRQLIQEDTRNVDNYPELILHSMLLNEYEVALDTFDAITALGNLPIRTCLYMGQLCRSLNLYIEENKFYKQGLRIDENWVPLLNLAGLSELRLGRIESSLSYFNKALEQSSLPHLYINKAHVFGLIGDWEAANELYSYVRELHPSMFSENPTYYCLNQTVHAATSCLNVVVESFSTINQSIRESENYWRL